MNFNKMYGLFLRHFYLIKGSLPRISDLIYWPIGFGKNLKHNLKFPHEKKVVIALDKVHPVP